MSGDEGTKLYEDLENAEALGSSTTFFLRHNVSDRTYWISSDVREEFTPTINRLKALDTQTEGGETSGGAYLKSLQEICKLLGKDEKRNTSVSADFGDPENEDDWPGPIGQAMQDLFSSFSELKDSLKELTKDNAGARSACTRIYKGLAHSAGDYLDILITKVSDAYNRRLESGALSTNCRTDLPEDIEVAKLEPKELSTSAESYSTNYAVARLGETIGHYWMTCHDLNRLTHTSWREDAEIQEEREGYPGVVYGTAKQVKTLDEANEKIGSQ